MIVQELFAKLGLEVDETAFAAAENALASLRTGFLGIGTAAVTGLALAAVAITKSTANAADDISKVSDRTGQAVDSVQRLAYAAKFADLELEDLTQVLTFMGKKGVRNAEEEIARLADQFQRMPNDGRRAQFLVEHFGKAGSRMGLLLTDGAEGFRALTKEAEEFGLFTPEAVKNSQDFNDEIDRLGFAFKALRNAVGVVLIKPLTKVVQTITVAVKWLRQLPAVLRENIQYLKISAALIGGVLLASLSAASGGLGALVLGFLSAGIAAVVAAAKAVVAWVAAALPILAMGAAIAFVILVLEDLYQFLTGGESVIGDFVDYVKEEFGSWGAFFEAIVEWIKYLFESLWDGIKSAAGSFFNWIGDKVRGFVSELVHNVIAEFANLGKKLAQVFPGLFNVTADVLTRLGVVDSNPFAGTGGASPAASVGSSVTAKAPTLNAPTFTNQQTINAAPGMSAEDLAGAAAAANEQWWDTKMSGGLAGME